MIHFPMLYSLLSNEWWMTRARTGALSDSYFVTTEELLVNRLEDTVLINHSVN